MKKITIPFYTDPGHGWLKVPVALINKLGISDKISNYSYIRKDHVYLEEDCDASVLIDTLGAQGVTIKYKIFHTNKSSKIRSYNSFRD
jgi:hydroxypyruvate isomerase